MRQPIHWLAALSIALLFGCGDGDGDNRTGDGGTGDGSVGDGDGSVGDGGLFDGGGPAGCVTGGPQCNNCIDDDHDGRTDGADIECTSSADNDEGSFRTGIPGDNVDTVKQDCFFDGDSGSGNDGCEIHVCCLLGAPDRASCPYGANQYDPAACDDPQSQQCIDVCAPLTPPGCDCFGCCTVCDPATDLCYDIVTNPATAPSCDETNIADPTACPRCTPSTVCGNPCNVEECILCPGQDPNDLPATCTTNQCPGTAQTCGGEFPCPTGSYCANGCCIANVP